MSDPVCYCPECVPNRDDEGVEELWRIQCHVRYVDACRVVGLPHLQARREALETYQQTEGAHRTELLRREVSRQWAAANPPTFARSAE